MPAQQNTLTNGVKLLGEAFVVPGSSLILDGRIGLGLLHSALGLAAISVLGPVAGPLVRLAVIANSYSKSVNDDHGILGNTRVVIQRDDEPADPAGTTGTTGATGSTGPTAAGSTRIS